MANLVGMMLFVQVILGGSATLLNFPVIYHIVWGGITFVVLIIAIALSAMEYATKSSLVKTGIASIGDCIVQIVLGFIALGTSNDTIVVVYLTNAFLLAVFATYFISFADSADKTAALGPSATKAL